MSKVAERQGSTSAPARSGCLLASAVALFGLFMMSSSAQAMRFDQMRQLAGFPLLGLRVDAVFNTCGLPAFIADSAGASTHQQILRWADVEMNLSSMDWDMTYSSRRDEGGHGAGWVNPVAGGSRCLSGLSGLVLHAKGKVGFLSTRKRADKSGYITRYDVPGNAYTAHQVTGLAVDLKQGVPASSLLAQYGKPDEILGSKNGTQRYLYWVVARNDKAMPVSVHAVEFEVKVAEKTCTQYTVQTSGAEFVQDKFDALQRQWEKDYVLD